MASLIPDTVTHLQAAAIVSRREMEALGGKDVLKHQAERMCRMTLDKLLNDCILVDDFDPVSRATMVRLDCYLLSRRDLLQIINNARNEGARDALRFGYYSPEATT